MLAASSAGKGTLAGAACAAAASPVAAASPPKSPSKNVRRSIALPPSLLRRSGKNQSHRSAFPARGIAPGIVMTQVTTRLALAALCTSGVMVVASVPASAQAGAAPTIAHQLTRDAVVEYAQYRRRGFVGRGYGGPSFRGGYGPRRYYGGGYGRRGIGTGALIGGLAAGALIGGAIASQAAPAPVYVEPQGDATAYCMQRFRSYDPASGTYLGYDGLRHPCP